MSETAKHPVSEGETSSPKRPKAEDVGADRKAEEFRNYKDSALQARVQNFYKTNHELQTYEVGRKLREQFDAAPVVPTTLMEAMEILNKMVDESDPDLDAAQTFHAYQTAEAARRVFPNDKWLHVCGLIHDCGKVLAHEKYGGFPQAFVVGDTYPLGCRPSEKIVFSQYFEGNPDKDVEAYNSELGTYKEHCGFNNVVMSYGHDEYLYHVLLDSNTKLPAEALYIVRFHSFYAHHQHTAYPQLMDETDKKLLSTLRRFQPCDLYSKSHDFPHMDDLRPYYEGLLKEFDLDKPLRFRKMTLPVDVPAAPPAAAEHTEAA